MPQHSGKHRRTGVLAALLLAAALGTSGCVALAVGAAAGAGTVAYVRGDLQARLDAEFEAAAEATDDALDALKFARISTRADATKAVYIARNAEDRKIEVIVSKKTAALSEVSIRVGIFGDEVLSRTILDQIKAEL